MSIDFHERAQHDGRRVVTDALLADGPHREHESELMLFGQFVGSWDIDWRGRNDEDGTWMQARGEWHFAWVLEGRAVQDVWIVPSRAERALGDLRKGEYGTTLRFYDPSNCEWSVTWHGPVYGNVRVFAARQEGDEIVLRGNDHDDRAVRWIFSDITDDAFRWRSLRLENDDSWVMREEMRVRRRPV